MTTKTKILADVDYAATLLGAFRVSVEKDFNGSDGEPEIAFGFISDVIARCEQLQGMVILRNPRPVSKIEAAGRRIVDIIAPTRFPDSSTPLHCSASTPETNRDGRKVQAIGEKRDGPDGRRHYVDASDSNDGFSGLYGLHAGDSIWLLDAESVAHVVPDWIPVRYEGSGARAQATWVFPRGLIRPVDAKDIVAWRHPDDGTRP